MFSFDLFNCFWLIPTEIFYNVKKWLIHFLMPFCSIDQSIWWLNFVFLFSSKEKQQRWWDFDKIAPIATTLLTQQRQWQIDVHLKRWFHVIDFIFPETEHQSLEWIMKSIALITAQKKILSPMIKFLKFISFCTFVKSAEFRFVAKSIFSVPIDA